MDILAEKVIFDADTKLPLTKEEMNQIDWTGSSSEQTREAGFMWMCTRFPTLIRQTLLL